MHLFTQIDCLIFFVLSTFSKSFKAGIYALLGVKRNEKNFVRTKANTRTAFRKTEFDDWCFIYGF